MKNLAIIPARSGSKGLKNKNIKLFNNKPLIAYTIEEAIRSEVFSEIIVSTDSPDYAKIASEYGATVPFIREKHLSSDTTSTWDVVKDIINKYELNGQHFNSVTILQPTSPLRTSSNIFEAYKMYMDKNADLVVSVCETDHSPLLTNTLPEDKSMENFIKKSIINTPRQLIPKYYRINGAIYIVKPDHLKKSEELYNNHSYAYVMDKFNSVDIDDNLDFKFAEFIYLNKDSL